MGALSVITATSCASTLGSSLQKSNRALSERWLERLVALVPVDARSVFPTDLLLDHIPALIDEIGKYVAEPADEDIAARSVVIAKARELGQLRHQQQASLHQVLREYDLLADVLEEFVIAETSLILPAPSLPECLDAWRRVERAVRVLMQITAGTFINEYTETVTAQGKRLDGFHRAIGHELRNVLGTLQFGATLLAGESAPDATHRHRLATTVSRNADRAMKIIRSFERLPRSGVLADKPTEQTADLEELIREVFRQLQEMADGRGVELRVNSESTLVYLDTGALELILINLIANAIKYSDHSKLTRFVAVETDGLNEHYEIRVVDNGIGIPREAATRVFERFVRAHAELDDELGVDGSGLGLAIVEECVNSLGGEIHVDSTEGVGTAFTIRIPKRLPPLSAASA
jgi:signal transduction histidine kinase